MNAVFTEGRYFFAGGNKIGPVLNVFNLVDSRLSERSKRKTRIQDDVTQQCLINVMQQCISRAKLSNVFLCNVKTQFERRLKRCTDEAQTTEKQQHKPIAHTHASVDRRRMG